MIQRGHNGKLCCRMCQKEAAARTCIKLPHQIGECVCIASKQAVGKGEGQKRRHTGGARTRRIGIRHHDVAQPGHQRLHWVSAGERRTHPKRRG